MTDGQYTNAATTQIGTSAREEVFLEATLLASRFLDGYAFFESPSSHHLTPFATGKFKRSTTRTPESELPRYAKQLSSPD